MKQSNEIAYQLKVILKGSKPTVWRRLQVLGNIDLHSLHQIIQTAMGWANLHLYRFEVNGTNYGVIDSKDDFYGLHFEDARKIKLNKVVSYDKSKTKFIYEYDFGDSWEHEIIVEQMIPFKDGVKYPTLLSGRQSCPPEDCGGLRGYALLLKSVRNPIEEEYERMMESCKTARILK
jgi:hypothetical protein